MSREFVLTGDWSYPTGDWTIAPYNNEPGYIKVKLNLLVGFPTKRFLGFAQAIWINKSNKTSLAEILYFILGCDKKVQVRIIDDNSAVTHWGNYAQVKVTYKNDTKSIGCHKCCANCSCWTSMPLYGTDRIPNMIYDKFKIKPDDQVWYIGGKKFDFQGKSWLLQEIMKNNSQLIVKHKDEIDEKSKPEQKDVNNTHDTEERKEPNPNDSNSVFMKYDEKVIMKLMESGIGTREQIIAASSLVEDYTDINSVANKVFQLKKPVEMGRNDTTGQEEKKLNVANESELEVRRWLVEDIRLGQYVDKFVNNGWDEMETILTMTENDLKEFINKAGHRRRIINWIERRRNNQNNNDNNNQSHAVEGNELDTAYI